MKTDTHKGNWAAFCFCFALLMGTGSTLSSKILYGIESQGRDGSTKYFQKPLMQTFMMFLAMSVGTFSTVLLLLIIMAACVAIPVQFINAYLTNQLDKMPKLDYDRVMVLAFPACADLGATALMSVGLLYVPVSTFQLVRCTIIVFVAALKVLFLKFRPTGYMKCGILLNSIAILMVSASCFGEEQEAASAAIGVSVLLLGCLVTSSQYVLEETVMSKKNGTPPMMVIGLEGIWGTLLMLAIVFPVAYWIPGNDNGSVEDFWDSCLMIYNNTAVASMCLFYIVCVTSFNIASIFVTFLLDSVWRSILANFRPVSVWSMDLALFYIFTSGTLGEPWSPWSWLQLAGMFLLFFGTAVYNGTVELKWFDYGKVAAAPLNVELAKSPVYGSCDVSKPASSSKSR